MNQQPLITSLRNWLADRPTRPPIGDDLEQLIDAHRLSGLLYHIGAHLGESIAQSAQKEWTNNAAAYLSRFRAVQEHWPSQASAPLLLKGADYIENLYFTPGARRCVDIDILVPPDSHDSVNAAFAQFPRRKDPLYERLPTDPIYAQGFMVGENLVELHRDAGPNHSAPLDVDSIYQRSLLKEIDGFWVRYPHPDDRLLLWLQNQSKSAFVDGLWSTVDLALILQERLKQGDIHELTRLKELATQYGLDNAFDLAMLRLDRHKIWPGRLQRGSRMLARFANRICIDADTPTIMAARWRRQSLKLWLCPTRRRPAMVARMLVHALSGPGAAD